MGTNAKPVNSCLNATACNLRPGPAREWEENTHTAEMSEGRPADNGTSPQWEVQSIGLQGSAGSALGWHFYKDEAFWEAHELFRPFNAIYSPLPWSLLSSAVPRGLNQHSHAILCLLAKLIIERVEQFSRRFKHDTQIERDQVSKCMQLTEGTSSRGKLVPKHFDKLNIYRHFRKKRILE